MLITGGRRGTVARRAGLAAAAASIMVVAGCSSVIDGHPSVAPAPSRPGPTNPSPVPSDFPSASASSSPTVAVTPAQLHALLMPAPGGSTGWGDSWGNNTFPTVQQFVTRQYPPESRASVVAELEQQGVTSITHRTWIARNGTQADVVLFAFATEAGATARYTVASTAQGNNTGVVSVPFSASRPAAAYRHTAADSDGYVTGIVYSHLGPIVMEIFTYTPKKRFDSTSTGSWSKTQIARL